MSAPNAVDELRPMMRTKAEKTIAYYMEKGMTPSQIDRKLGLRDGTARRAVSHAWQIDRGMRD